jgi:redox-sensitive bicupin YhaK (pirin superfamily)
MAAGDGIVHSEFNASETEPSHSLQIASIAKLTPRRTS